ncbi:ATP-binding protein [Candidatus Woesearchaeota archaeon]|nr:ATP-binding protein [Candidatus Woesearchaeota archaeon]
MRSIAITGGKGGTGKSTVATALAMELAKTCRVLLADADVECPNDHLIINAKLKKLDAVSQTIPKWNLKKCSKCGLCAKACKKDAIVFVKEKYPAFVKNMCIGCGACIPACPAKAITSSKKQIGTIYTGRNYGVELISGELTLGELASGEIVSTLRAKATEHFRKIKGEILIIDSAAGVGCPVIASLKGTDYIVAVTEPTPSALHDLKRVIYLANHFGIPHGIVINKYNLESKFLSKIESYVKKEKIKIIGKIPYHHDFVEATVKMKPIAELNKSYKILFQRIINRLKEENAI